MMIWAQCTRADREARAITDRHYNRQKPGTSQFVPPGRCVVLKTPSAVWVASWPLAAYVRHAWAGAWVNSCFRRESGEMRASDMIREAVAATRWIWPEVPALGLITFVDARQVRHKRDPGRCYLRAGFSRVGLTAGGLIALQLRAADMPAAEPPLGAQAELAMIAGARSWARPRVSAGLCSWRPPTAEEHQIRCATLEQTAPDAGPEPSS